MPCHRASRLGGGARRREFFSRVSTPPVVLVSSLTSLIRLYRRQLDRRGNAELPKSVRYTPLHLTRRDPSPWTTVTPLRPS